MTKSLLIRIIITDLIIITVAYFLGHRFGASVGWAYFVLIFQQHSILNQVSK